LFTFDGGAAVTETVLVTGGTGFVAGWCIAELLGRGYAVRTTVRSLSKEPAVRAALAPVVDSTDRLSFVRADLTRDEGWDAAVAGCDYVLHVASPLGADAPRDRDALIGPARDGALRVLRAATKAGVRRVVMTSGTAAATPAPGAGNVGDETVWTDPDDPNLNAYRRSKVIAERAAWDFMMGNTGPTTLTTILPGAVFGPVLTTANLGSVQVIGRLLHGRPPGIPRLGFWIVDVRDLADLHIRAITCPEAAGGRFIAVGDFMWMQEIATTLRATLGEHAARVPTRVLPDFAVRLISLFVPPLRAVTPGLGHYRSFDSTKARQVLGFTPRPGTTTVVECAQSLTTARLAAAM
jgi:nucleoside-diphosphate-sugar epimerase